MFSARRKLWILVFCTRLVMVETNYAAEIQKKNKSIFFYQELDTFIQKIYTSECFFHPLQMHFKCDSLRLIVYALKTDQGESGDWGHFEVRKKEERGFI